MSINEFSTICTYCVDRTEEVCIVCIVRQRHCNIARTVCTNTDLSKMLSSTMAICIQQLLRSIIVFISNLTGVLIDCCNNSSISIQLRISEYTCIYFQSMIDHVLSCSFIWTACNTSSCSIIYWQCILSSINSQYILISVEVILITSGSAVLICKYYISIRSKVCRRSKCRHTLFPYLVQVNYIIQCIAIILRIRNIQTSILTILSNVTVTVPVVSQLSNNSSLRFSDSYLQRHVDRSMRCSIQLADISYINSSCMTCHFINTRLFCSSQSPVKNCICCTSFIHLFFHCSNNLCNRSRNEWLTIGWFSKLFGYTTII